MPRTKQNNPKNLKAGRNESTGRGSDSIKGLKRKKVVAENQLKKIPKSPIKKLSQTKKSVSPTDCALSKEATPACLFSKSTPHSTPKSAQDTEDDQQETLADESVKVENKDLTSLQSEALVHRKGKDKTCVVESMLAKSWSEKVNNKGTSASHTAAPLEVLLKAMEPDFNTLTEKKNCSSIGQLGKATSVPVPQSNAAIAMPSINFGLQSQPAVMQSYTAAKPPFCNSASTGVLFSQHHSSQQHLSKAVNCQNDKPGLQKSFSAGPSFNLTYAPVPSGSGGLPQSQPPIVQTCQSLSATVPNPIQVPVTPGFNPLQVATVVNFGINQMCDVSTKEQKTKKQGKYVCEYCNRACAKPSVLLKHIRSHTGERPYPCVTCGFSFKTKSNLYKHKKSHAHAIKLGLISKDSGSGSLSQESDRGLGTNSDVEESGESDEEVNTADLDPESSHSSLNALSESSLHRSGTVPGSQGDADHSVMGENIKPLSSQKGCEPKVTAALPKVVVYPVNVSPLRADSPRVTDSHPEQVAAQRQRDFQTASLRSSITVLSSLKEVDCTSPLPDFISEDENQQCKSPSGSGHAQLQRQQATDHSQQPQGKCLLSPRSLGSTDSGYFSRSESADQAMSPPSPFVKITPPTESELKNPQILSSPVVATVMHVATSEKPPVLPGQMRPPLETKALSLEERITKLISENEAVVDAKQLDSVKPRRTSLSRRGSIDSPKSYIFKDSFQFDLKPVVRRSSSNSDIPKSPFTPTDKSKPIFLLSVPPQYPTIDCLPITRSNSVPATPGRSAVLPNATPQPHPLRICQSFDDKFSSLNDDVFSPAPSTPNQVVHRTLVRQTAVEDFSTNDGHVLLTVHSMDESHYGSSITHETRSKSFDHAPEKTRKTQQSKGTTYECETCRNRYRKLENFENHKKFYCSELHGPKNKTLPVRDVESEVFASVTQQPVLSRSTIIPSIVDQPMIRKRRKMKSVGDDEDQSPTETPPPCSRSFDSCHMPMGFLGNSYTQHTPTSSNHPSVGQIQLIARGIEEARLSPIREIYISTCSKERAELQRQGSGTSVIRHTNSLSRPNSFEMSESSDRSSPADSVEKDANSSGKRHVETISSSLQSYHEKMSTPKCPNQGMNELEKQTSSVTIDSCTSTQSRLVRQNNIQVPEILVTEEPDREHESQVSESTEKTSETFNWPQRSESLSKLPTEKLPPKKKRIRLAQMEHSSGESSFESSLSRSLSRDSSLSRCSSISASFDREDPPRSDSPSRVEGVRKPPEIQGLPIASNTLGVPGMMRRAASEQISCTQQSVEISCDYRSKSFDSSISPSRSTSPMVTTLPKNKQCTPTPQVPLIERRRGPLVRQMSLKIGPETQQPTGKPTVSLQRGPSTNIFSVSQHRSLNVNKPVVLHSGESPLKKNVKMVQSVNLGSQTQQPQIHGLPHPWHQTTKLDKSLESLVQVVQDEADIRKSVDADPAKNFVPKYQLQYPVLKTGQAHSFTSVQGARITLPVITIPIANEIKVSTFNDGNQNIYETQSIQQSVPNRGVSVLPIDPGVDPVCQSFSDPAAVPQILITPEHTLPPSTVDSKVNLSEVNINAKIASDRQNGRSPGSLGSQMKTIIPAIRQNHIGEIQNTSPTGSLHCTQKLVSVSLCPQQEPTASSKRMLSPANSLDIAMEKTQKRAKDDHGAACLTDGRSLSYLNSKMSELTRQRKLMLVRQVCTTEPVDSPIETDAPEQLPECTEPEKNNQIEICHTKCDVEQEMESRTPTTTVQTVPGSDTHSSSGMQSNSGPANTTLKSQEKPGEHQWSPAKSHVRPQGFQGQIKLAASVSVVNTRDSHRLSFPSLKTATTFTWCFLLKRKPLHIEQTDQRISAYSTWTVKSKNPNPLGLPTKVVMSLFDSKQITKKILYTQAITTSLKSDILTYSGKLKDVLPKVLAQQNALLNENCGKAKPESQSNHELDSSKTEPRRVKIFDGGYKSNEEYVYVRGRGRGKYICEECGIRCKKPSMLRKHIRTHTDVRPYHCAQCNFSFKTKGNLTKHMKSKAHSKKCMEMGVAIGVIDEHETEDSGGDNGRAGNADRPDSDGDDSDGPDDEDNDGEEEDEEDSQAESGLSATPSVSASPQHLQSSQADPAPSSLLAQMSISPNPNPTSLPQIPGSYSQALGTGSMAITSSVSLVRQMSSSAVCSSHGPSPSSFVPYPAPTSESNSSDTESVHMMSPVSPCRQMSIDYPDPDVPPSPPMPSKNSLSGQDESTTSNSQTTNESNSNVDRSTQTTSDSLQGSLHFPSLGPDHESGTGATTRLFSHLPLHSQQPTRSPHSMVPVGGIQLVPAGLAAYSTFVPIQAGPVQLTIPAVSVIHRQANSPLPVPNTSPQPQGSPCQPLVVQEPLNSVLPCFPLGQMAGLQTLSASQATLQPVGMETLSVVGLANSTHLVPQQNLALNAALGVQVLAASPAPQSSTASPGHIPGLQILNIALPALIPSLSPLSALSPLVPDKPGSPERVASVSLSTQVAESPPATSPSGSFPAAWPAATPVAVVPVAVKPLVEMTSPSKPTRCGKDVVLSTIDSEKAKSTPQPHPSSSTEGESESAQKTSSVEVGEARLPRQPITRQQVIDDFNNVSSDDEDRLVIAT
ncbi:zinc finger protein 40 isoform X2 [Hemibagrus wyckioides]|uniref:zinc finger protein 40 isoform X2 n=1 Tax=Hemibagrus wyckioides TaxID=337641 RepID=UPI00266DBF20|nr:zinc finger protein 40 isoform X2 [Hemibagrus wyckioides]XP_058234237.1 zinc finger protein 40 isoform X2 [Hemibagrus wyckioides]XP_058234238.1 zinc finger protein 40 isoform X2 [Hemibagrus wyckioides]XP_058234239.1 zinc finger protein 40 isoform X2 [Hemibagrus wyckioides]XP_058234240.1 zinc finger protein 40 isoform X2 [Hemibagrus wyckioides]